MHRVIGRIGRDAQAMIRNAGRADDVPRRLLIKQQADLQLIARRRAIGRVVNLEEQHRLARQVLGQPLRIDHRVIPRHVRREEAGRFIQRHPPPNARVLKGRLRQHEDQHMMHHSLVSGDDLGAPHPGVLLKVGRHHHHLIRHHPIGLDGDRLGNLIDRIGRPDTPLPFRKLCGQRQIRFISAGLALPDPRGNRLLLPLTQRSVIRPRACCGRCLLAPLRTRCRGEPRRHDPIVCDRSNHRSPLRNGLERLQTKWRDATRAMTLDAVVLHDAGNVTCVRHRRRTGCGLGARRGTFKRTSRRVGRLNHRVFPAQCCVKRGFQESLPRRIVRIAHTVLVAHRAPIHQRVAGIDHMNFGRCHRAKGRGDGLIGVVEVEPPERSILDLSAHLIFGVDAAHIHIDELDALGCIRGFDPRQLGRELAAQGAGDAGQRHHRQLVAPSGAP